MDELRLGSGTKLAQEVGLKTSREPISKMTVSSVPKGAAISTGMDNGDGTKSELPRLRTH